MFLEIFQENNTWWPNLIHKQIHTQLHVFQETFIFSCKTSHITITFVQIFGFSSQNKTLTNSKNTKRRRKSFHLYIMSKHFFEQKKKKKKRSQFLSHWSLSQMIAQRARANAWTSDYLLISSSACSNTCLLTYSIHESRNSESIDILWLCGSTLNKHINKLQQNK
jgi:hypothetical protein